MEKLAFSQYLTTKDTSSWTYATSGSTNIDDVNFKVDFAQMLNGIVDSDKTYNMRVRFRTIGTTSNAGPFTFSLHVNMGRRYNISQNGTATRCVAILDSKTDNLTVGQNTFYCLPDDNPPIRVSGGLHNVTSIQVRIVADLVVASGISAYSLILHFDEI